jgi:hypothetical protein
MFETTIRHIDNRTVPEEFDNALRFQTDNDKRLAGIRFALPENDKDSHSS